MSVITTDTGWEIDFCDEDYIFISRPNRPGVIQIKAESEGYVVDIYDSGQESSMASTYATYNELADGEEDQL